jgi:hypothetical protein
MGDAFTWTNTGAGDWGTASNWFDVTAGTPASTPPGPADTAEIDNPGTGNITVTGPADIAGLQVGGQVALAGSYTVGAFVLGVPPFDPSFFGPTLTSTIALAGNFSANSLSIGNLHLVPGFSSDQVADYGIVEVDQGAILSAGTVTLNAGDLQVDGGAVKIANNLTLGTDLFPDPVVNAVALTTGSLDVANHGSVQLGGLAITDGSVNLDATSTLEIGDAGTAAAGTITIDPGAALSEGDAPAYLVLAIRNAETVSISSPLLNNGTIYSAFDVSNVINNGVIFANNATVRSVSGDGLLDLQNAGTIGPGVSGTLDFNAFPSTVFDLGAGVPIDTTDTPLIVNFSTIAGSPSPMSDTIVLDGIIADSATYTPTGPGIGTLMLYDGGTASVASLTMLGTYASNAFIVTPGSSDSVVSLSTVAVTNSYTWIAPGSGDWATPSNWFDVSTGTPTAVAPGPADTAEIDNPGTGTITVTGPADVAGLLVSGDVTLAGSYTVGSLGLAIHPSNGLPAPPPGGAPLTLTSTIALAGTFDASSLTIGFSTTPLSLLLPPTFVDTGYVQIDQGSVLSAGSARLNSGDLLVDGGSVDIRGALTLGTIAITEGGLGQLQLASGTLDVIDHASVTAGDLYVSGGEINLDATSTLEIGGAGTAAAGTITVDPDAVLQLTHFGSLTAGGAGAITLPILNNGTIDTSADLSNTINNGTIYIGDLALHDVTLSSISGNGQIGFIDGGVTDGRFCTIGASVGGTLNFDSFKQEVITFALGSGVPIDGTDTPAINGFSEFLAGGDGDPVSQTIILQDISADTATYTTTGPGIGTLMLYDGGTASVASLTMLGTYASNAFIVTPGSGDSVVSLSTVAVGNVYTWIAPGSGDWATPSNWFDVTTGTPTAVAPGPADTAEIDNTGTSAMTVMGPGDAGTASVSGDVTLAGSYTIDTLNLGMPPGTTVIDGPITGTFISTISLGGTFDVSSLTIGYANSDAAIYPPYVVDIGVVNVDTGSALSVGYIDLASGDLLVDGGSVDSSAGLYLGTILTNGPVTEVLAEGTLDITDHGSVSLGGLYANPGAVELDATSTLEIGSDGTATAGTIAVDPNATIVLNGADIAAPILNNGTIQAYSDLSNTINNGTIIFGSPRISVTLSDISGNGQIDIDGNGDVPFLHPLVIGPNVSGTLNLPTFSDSTVTIDLGPGVPINTTDTPGIEFGPYSQYYENQVVLQGISADTATYTATGAGIGTLALYEDTTEVASLTLLGTYTSNAFIVTPGSGDSVVTPNPACFAAGTRIATPRGEVAVEALSSGDAVTLVSGGTAPIVWIGRRRVDCRSHPTPHDVWPVRIRRSAFAPGVPHRDLFLSPDHAVFAENVLIPIKHLTNGDTVRQVEREAIEYFHIELSQHDVLLADGLPVESYLDTGDRGSFENGGRVVALFPVFSPFAWDALGCAPLVVTGPPVAAVRRRIERQARRLNGTRQRRRNTA